MSDNLFLVGWIACGIIHYGYIFSYMQGRFSSIARENVGSDRAFAFLSSLFGPLAILTSLIVCEGKKFFAYGWRIK